MAKRSGEHRFQQLLLEGLVPVYAVGHEPDRDDRQREGRESERTHRHWTKPASSE